MCWAVISDCAAGNCSEQGDADLRGVAQSVPRAYADVDSAAAVSESGGATPERQEFARRCEQRNIVIEFTPPCKPTQNAFVERFNGIYRDGVLDAKCFMTLSQVREETERWPQDYSTLRPHESLGDVSPIEFLADRGHAEKSSYGWS